MGAGGYFNLFSWLDPSPPLPQQPPPLAPASALASPSTSVFAALPLYDRVQGFLWNAVTGTLSDAQKQALIAQEHAGIIRAGGNPSTAPSQAHSDVTSVLVLNKADPSQASVFNNPGLDGLLQKSGWLIAIAGGYFLYRIYLTSQGKR